MAKRSDRQQRIIRNYYDNKDEIMLQRLGGLITDLYLAEGRSQSHLWQRAAAAMKNLKVPESQIQQIVQSNNPSLLAKLLEQLLAKKS